jgi:hypothetical protein
MCEAVARIFKENKLPATVDEEGNYTAIQTK